MGEKIGMIVVVLFLLGVAFYILGTLKPVLQNGFHYSGEESTSSRLISPLTYWTSGGTSTQDQGRGSPIPPPQAGSSPPPPSPTISPYDIPKGFTLSDLSPYFHAIRFGSAYGSYAPGYGMISLNFSAATGSIDVTNWVLEGYHGTVYVPQAVNRYDPQGQSPEGSIVLSYGQTVSMYLGAPPSPIGKNVRLNKCLGYLQNTLNFVPQIPQSCPYSNLSEVRQFSGACYDYVSSLGGCREPISNPPIPQYDYRCRDLLHTLNYKGCVDTYGNDSDFLGNEWRVWVGSQLLDPAHDRVVLKDKNGLVVDVREY